MDEEADAGDDQQHDERELVERKAKSTWKAGDVIQRGEHDSTCRRSVRPH